ncbi:hypothetical protein ACOQFL_15635 [Actinopolyspora sp. H202]|uniref:hypothetical protein n=1 Tax=Actinopolyspora sp. H202 TaxID=1500456 RepID=UPI003EE7C934
MLDEIRGRLQRIIDTAPAGELQAVQTTLDELRGQLHQVAAILPRGSTLVVWQPGASQPKEIHGKARP